MAICSLSDDWQRSLQGITPLALPTDYPGSPHPNPHAGIHQHTLSPGLLLDLRELARQADTTLDVVLLTTLGLLFARLSGQSDILLAIQTAHPTPMQQTTAGPFANALVLRLTLDPKHPVSAQLNNVKDQVLEALSRQVLPFDQLIPADCHPIAQIAFTFINDSAHKAVTLNGEGERMYFDLEVHATESPEGLECTWRFRRDLWKSDTLSAWTQRWEAILRITALVTLLKATDDRHLNHVEIANPQSVDPHQAVFAAVARWTGKRLGPDGLLFGFNLSGTKTPLLWCANALDNLLNLAQQLGPDQPIYGMHSGIWLMKCDPEVLHPLANRYATQVSAQGLAGPVVVGGFCFGGYTAFELAEALMRQDVPVPLLILIDAPVTRPYAGRVALIQARNAATGDPFRRFSHPEQAWTRLYRHWSLDTVEGIHQEAMDRSHISQTASCIRQRMDEALAEPLSRLPTHAYQHHLAIVDPDHATLPWFPGECRRLMFNLSNQSAVYWPDGSHSGLALLGRWRNAKSEVLTWHDGATPLSQGLAPQQTLQIAALFTAPRETGVHQLEVDLVEQGITWFSDRDYTLLHLTIPVQQGVQGLPMGEMAKTAMIPLAQSNRLATLPQRTDQNNVVVSLKTRADALRHRGHQTDAIDLYQQGLDYLLTQTFDFYLQMARAHREQRTWPKALLALDQALVLRPNDPLALCERAEIQNQSGDRANAVLTWQQLFTLYPQQSQNTMVQLALALLAEGQAESALKLLQQSIKKSSKHLPSQLALGETLERLDHWTEARDLYQRVINENPHHGSRTNHLIRLARAQARCGDFASAGNTLAGADPTPDLLRTQGDILRQQGRFGEAAETYQQVLTLAPQDRATLKALIGMQIHPIRNAETAVRWAEQAIARDSTYADYHSLLGRALALQKRHCEALAALDQALTLRGGGDAGLFITRAQQKRALGSQSGAIEDLRQALITTPHHPAALLELVPLLVAEKQIHEARSLLQAALVQNPGHPDLAAHLGELLLKQDKDPETALAVLEQSLSKHPNHFLLNLRQGEALSRMSRWREAQEAFQVAVQCKPKHPYAHACFDNARRKTGLAGH